MTTPTQQQQALAKSSNGRGGGNASAPEAENVIAQVLENTLWNRQLGVMSEEIVAALVCQIFEGAHIWWKALVLGFYIADSCPAVVYAHAVSFSRLMDQASFQCVCRTGHGLKGGAGDHQW